MIAAHARLGVTKKAASDLFEFMDVNRSGEVSKEEFLQAYKGQRVAFEYATYAEAAWSKFTPIPNLGMKVFHPNTKLAPLAQQCCASTRTTRQAATKRGARRASSARSGAAPAASTSAASAPSWPTRGKEEQEEQEETTRWSAGSAGVWTASTAP